MTRQTRLLLGLLAVLAAAGAYWFLLLAPKRQEAAELAAQVETKRAAVAQAEATLASYRQAQATYPRLATTVARLGKAVPADDDVRSLVVQLESAAAGSDVEFGSIKVGTPSAAATPSDPAAAPATPAPPGAAPVGGAGFSTMSFNLEFRGSYLRLSELFARLERFVRVRDDRIDVTGRLVRVEGVTLSPVGEDHRNLSATVSASTYLVPAAEGVGGGAPATGATAPADGSTPPAGGTQPPTPTAITTGALR